MAAGASHDLDDGDPLMRKSGVTNGVHRMHDRIDGGIETDGFFRARHVVVNGRGYGHGRQALRR